MFVSNVQTANCTIFANDNVVDDNDDGGGGGY